jgi:hypothetical protein
MAIVAFALHGQEPRVRFVGQFSGGAANANAVLYYSKAKAELSKINAALNDNALLGWGVQAADFENPPANAPKPDLSRHAGDAWALYYMGRMLASGKDAPTPDGLQNALAGGGVPNKVLALKRFLAANPNNLDGRLELMRELNRHARARTMRALNRAPLNMSDMAVQAAATGTLAPEAVEELGADDDANIWGELAGMFAAAFNTEEWVPLLPEFYNSISENMALYSPAMKAVYRRNLPKVEDELMRRQTDLGLWGIWREMAQTTGRRILDFFPQIPPLPKESNWAWPPVRVVQWVRQEAKAANNWPKIIEFDWPYWPNTVSGLNMFAPVNQMPPSTPLLTAQRDQSWNGIFPLFEACLNEKDYGKVDEIYFEIASRPVFEREAKLAFDMAKKHNYALSPVHREDSNRPAPEVQSFIGDPLAGNVIRIAPPPANRLRDLVSGGHLRMLVVDPSETNNNYQRVIYSMNQGKLPEYMLMPFSAKPDSPIAKELIEQEGLPGNAFLWGILDDSGKYHHGGSAAPSPDNIQDLLNSMRRKTRLEIFREFAKDYPESMAAKGVLLDELKIINTMKTAMAMALQRAATANANAAQAAPSAQMEESTDSEIWGEFFSIANSIFPQIIARPDSLSLSSPFKMRHIEASPLFRQFAARRIAAVEEALAGRPHSRGLWELWGIFAPYAPNRSLPQFLATLTPVPDKPDFPPIFLYPDLIRNYQSLWAWRPIIDLVEPMWESYQSRYDAKEDIKHRLTEELWKQYINPLCDAYEKTGQDQKAEKMRQTWKQAEGWR